MLKHFRAFWKSQGIDEDEYLGNMWGWKFSYIGLGMLTFLIALYFFRVIYYPQEVNNTSSDKTEISVKPVGE